MKQAQDVQVGDILHWALEDVEVSSVQHVNAGTDDEAILIGLSNSDAVFQYRPDEPAEVEPSEETFSFL